MLLITRFLNFRFSIAPRVVVACIVRRVRATLACLLQRCMLLLLLFLFLCAFLISPPPFLRRLRRRHACQSRKCRTNAGFASPPGIAPKCVLHTFFLMLLACSWWQVVQVLWGFRFEPSSVGWCWLLFSLQQHILSLFGVTGTMTGPACSNIARIVI